MYVYINYVFCCSRWVLRSSKLPVTLSKSKRVPERGEINNLILVTVPIIHNNQNDINSNWQWVNSFLVACTGENGHGFSPGQKAKAQRTFRCSSRPENTNEHRPQTIVYRYSFLPNATPADLTKTNHNKEHWSTLFGQPSYAWLTHCIHIDIEPIVY